MAWTTLCSPVAFATAAIGIGLGLFGGALLVAAGLMFAARSRSDRRAGARATLAS